MLTDSNDDGTSAEEDSLDWKIPRRRSGKDKVEELSRSESEGEAVLPHRRKRQKKSESPEDWTALRQEVQEAEEAVAEVEEEDELSDGGQKSVVKESVGRKRKRVGGEVADVMAPYFGTFFCPCCHREVEGFLVGDIRYRTRVEVARMRRGLEVLYPEAFTKRKAVVRREGREEVIHLS